jgi:hypothetical protein
MMTRFLVAYFAVGLLFVWLAGLLVDEATKTNARAQAYAAQQQHYHDEHKCKRTGFAGRYPEAVYTCDDGQVYLWGQFPRQ